MKAADSDTDEVRRHLTASGQRALESLPQPFRTSVIPKSLRAIREVRMIEIEWPEAPLVRIAFRDLRLLCPCAACVDEMTGERIVNPRTVPDDVAPAAMKYSGNYALKISWSDGHDTGIYTWEYLSKLPLEQLEQLGEDR